METIEVDNDLYEKMRLAKWYDGDESFALHVAWEVIDRYEEKYGEIKV